MCVTLRYIHSVMDRDIVDIVVLCLCDTQIGFDLEKKWPKKESICSYETNMLKI